MVKNGHFTTIVNKELLRLGIIAYEAGSLVPPILGSTLTIIMYHLLTARLGKLELYKTETLVKF